MKVIAEEPWAWMLLSNESGVLYLSVMCGTVGLYSIDFQLTDDEAADFHSTGRSAVDLLARDVSNQPFKYQDRHMLRFTDLPGVNEAFSDWRRQRSFRFQ